MYMQPQQERGQEQTQRQQQHTPVPQGSINSLLVADCGTVYTKVSLFGLVEGQYRLMARGQAPTTVAPPQEDITEGIMQAIQRIEAVTGRRFMKDGQIITPEQEDGNGTDIFIATISAGGPLRMVILGAVSKNLEELARQAVSGLYVETEALPAPSFLAVNEPVPVGGGQARPWSAERMNMERERQLAAMQELQPHAALIVGMADGPSGPMPLREACELLVDAAGAGGQSNAPRPATPQYTVIYAGAPQYTEATRNMVQSVAEMARVEPLVSQAQLGAISIAAAALHERVVLQRIPGYQRLLSWSSAAPVATTTSLSSLVRFLAQHYAMNVTAVDLGGMTTTVMVAGEKGEFIPKVNAGVGIGPGIGAVLQLAGVQRLARWLPFPVTEEELRQFVLNQIVHPQVIPTSKRELQISHAFAREAIILTMEEAKRHAGEWLESDLILATGATLAHAPTYGQVAMILLDTLQPRGVVSLVLDPTMLITQLGAVATVAPVTAVQVNENDAVTHRLGTCVIPFGDVRPGQVVLRVEVEYNNGRSQQIEVVGGTMAVIPLQMNEQALLSLFPAPGVDVGLGPGERARAAEEIDGGLLGLIIDARGRPLALPPNDSERQLRLQQWAQALGA